MSSASRARPLSSKPPEFAASWPGAEGHVLRPSLGDLDLAFLVVATWVYGSVPFSWTWAPLTLLFVAERIWTVRRNPWRDILLAALLLPEWAYEQWRSGVYWLAVWKTIRGAKRVWINAGWPARPSCDWRRSAAAASAFEPGPATS